MSLRKRISALRSRLSERPSKEPETGAETGGAPGRRRSNRAEQPRDEPWRQKRTQGRPTKPEPDRGAPDQKRGRGPRAGAKHDGGKTDQKREGGKAPDQKRARGRKSESARGRDGSSAEARARLRRPRTSPTARKRGSKRSGDRQRDSADARRLAGSAATAARTKLIEPAGKLLAAFARTWLAVAERAGALVLAAWQRYLRPLLAILIALTVAAYRWLERHLTPARAVVAVCLVALVALAVSQWLDYRSIAIGTEAYSGQVEAVADAPELDRARAGDAHGWVMVPLAVAGAVALGLALSSRRRAARALIAIGAAVIAISVLIDAPKGLDEGAVGVAYGGARASLIEGFWLQIACAVVLIAAGVLLPRYLQTEPRPAPVKGARTGVARRLAGRADRARKRASEAAKRPPRDGKPRIGQAGR